MKKIGIITFHNSYNCGSMLESFAMQEIIKKRGAKATIIDFSNIGQRNLYDVFIPNNSLKNVIKNILVYPHRNRVKNNNSMYEKFKKDNFNLTNKSFSTMDELTDDDYDVVVAGSDQIWNITIDDSDDAYFLPWVKQAKKVAYSPSFGSKNILKYSENPDKYKKFLLDFDSLSVRENNGKKWIKDLCDRDVDVLLDPTLLLEAKDYDKLIDNNYTPEGDYIFFYCPSFDKKICEFVKKIADKYKIKVIAWSTKSYYFKFVSKYGFELVPYETPALYLSLIKNAKLVITTSFHGTIFSTIYRKNFITVKNGGMYGDDDRVRTLLDELNMNDRLIPFDFKDDYDYMKDVNYGKEYSNSLNELKNKSIDYIDKNIIKMEDTYERN
ncbi:polysaccharide pyruvyl transferase family protein [Streptococcus thermophilus]|uniref:Gll3707 protein n=1 Tax=Streptococcus thermophilus TaxID=1308 RepID=A0A4Y3UGK3_STRTR|nr:polysaccharide pyruvyl transferase family protein [Streptococcus thermophilus]MDI3552142.1 polysaccharide pyruvyl transferase family protein [Streptococcus thermophilus]QBR99962.1 Gll3707 protein [Streptococcus thermophilus]GEB93262.1 hypothetical protein STH02_12920 [Streptococcus thermophilus]